MEYFFPVKNSCKVFLNVKNADTSLKEITVSRSSKLSRNFQELKSFQELETKLSNSGMTNSFAGLPPTPPTGANIFKI